MNYLAKYILIPIVITAATTFGIQNYIPLDWIDIFQPQKFGTTITTIAGTDTISGSRTTINNNFSNLNLGKMETSTTSVKSITTLESLVSIGTITTGTWTGTAVGVGYGGTGTTSPSRYQIMLGNGSLGLTMASSTGTSGQFLTSNGAGAYPSWQTSSVDQTLTYYWTGRHAWKNTTSVFDATNMYIASTTGTLGIATTSSSITNGVNIGADTYISKGLGVGISTTTDGNLEVSGDVLIGDDLMITGDQIGGRLDYAASSTAFSTNQTLTYIGSIPTNANFGMVSYSMAGSTCDLEGFGMIARIGITSFSADGIACKYTFLWSGNDLQITENEDETSSVNGTVYWYK